jgi:hypothetical protein
MALAMDDSPQELAGTQGERADSREQPAGTDTLGEEKSVEIHPPHQPTHSVREFLVQLVTITTGVLIALSLEGALEWNHYRMLVREARETIAREIADNKNEIDTTLADLDKRQQDLDTALRMTGELLKAKKSGIRQVGLGFSFAELSAASWQSAERTGAVAHMEYAEVQEYTRLYGVQQLFADHQRQTLQRLTTALAIVAGGDLHSAAPRDLELLRQQMLAVRADLSVQQQLGQQLAKLYGEMVE